MDASKVRDTGIKLLERGKLGEISLLPSKSVFYHEPGLSLNRITGDQVIREGHQLVLSCIAQGSQFMSFRWLKDGDPINVTKSAGIMWTNLIPKTDRQEYTAVLGIEKVDALDEGYYTCQIYDWGLQECKSIYIEVVQAPQVQVLPMSASLQKGESINLKCVSPNEGRWVDQDQIGYSWARDKKLFPLNPGQEVWEDLKPSGSILRVQNIQKSTTYTCKAHTSAATREQSVRIDVINHTSVDMCKEEIEYGTRWSIASPGSTALSECPFKYIGVARRQCLLDQPGVAFWQNPDFSNCISERFDKIIRDFRILARGFVKTSIENTLSELVLFLEDQGELYPGEGEPMVELLQDILNYINRTSSWNDLIDSTIYLYKAINLLLIYNESIVNEYKLRDLQILVNRWSLLFGEHMNGTMSHFSFDSFVIDIMKVMDYNHNSYYIPTLSNSYPLWYNVRIAVHVAADEEELSFTSNRIAVINYRNISKFLPLTSTQKNYDGTEITYEIQSNIISVAIAGHLSIHLDLELHVKRVREGWNITCANAPSLATNWDMSSCHYSVKKYNITHCVCRYPGVYTALITRHSSQEPNGMYKNLRLASVVIIGCTCCLIQSLLALVLLLVRWWYRKTCLLFLKLQCCTSVAAIMSIFIYTSRCTPSQNTYTYTTILMEALMLLGISTHLSKLLVVYTEVVRLPNVKNIKKTVFGITTGGTLLAVLCSLLAHKLSGNTLKSWWLPYDSAIFFIALTCAILITAMFIFLFCNLLRRLKFLLCVQDVKTNHIISRRIGLLKRTAVLFTAVVSVAISSVLYVNSYNKLYHYLFSILCALLGFIIFLCYVLHSESSLHLHLLTQLKMQKSKDQDYSSDSDHNLFNFFTKQEAEVESDCAPPLVKGTPTKIINELTPMNEKLLPKPKMVTFNGEDVICEKKDIEDVDLEIYPNSPKKYKCINLTKNPGCTDTLNEEESVALNSPTLQETSFKIDSMHTVSEVPDVLTTRACVEIGLEMPNLIVTNDNLPLVVGGSAGTSNAVVISNSLDPPLVDKPKIIPIATPKCPDISRSSSTGASTSSVINKTNQEVDQSGHCFLEVKQAASLAEEPLLNPAIPSVSGDVLPTIMEDEDGDEEKDVLDRITHDLDYLLNRRPDSEVITYQRHKKQQPTDSSKSIPGSSFVAKTTL
ncbi:hypothetical protein O3M35_001054 [Rhynocoris fuscipes]|uniref:Uncharacterized protein n=1 Tax=Rhynocoris fuscipes TaxID=488301 RepID=A0AAW1DT57_9HEMI